MLKSRSCSRDAEHPAGFFCGPAGRAIETRLELYALRQNGTEFPVEISLNWS